MGNSESNESAAVKRQAEGGACPMYDLLDLSGGGALFYITKRAMIKKDYKELDEAIKSKITPYLYNGGKGKMVPVVQLTMIRNRDRGKSKQFPQIRELGDDAFNFVFEDSELLQKMTDGQDPETSPHMFRECCWMVEKRGSVGETAFHVCFLMQTPTHLALARRLLKWYPKLINDVYLSEEYYGENVLHMSVVAEDPTMVKYLLDEGVNIHERCYGNFFCPEDQKASRNDSLEHEIVDVCLHSNYHGYVSWGEYPLSFAAVLSQEECYRLILSRGGNHDLTDTNGNSVTHIMVVYDNMKMFDLAVEGGASINIKNNMNMTPLTVAAYLARQDMFFHIANIEREVYWQIGNVCCSAYPIEQLDTINAQTGELNMQSALNLIVFGLLTEHLDLIEGVVVDLLQTKWKSFIKASFFRQLYTFAFYFFLSGFCFITRPSRPRVRSGGGNSTSLRNDSYLFSNESLFEFENGSELNDSSGLFANFSLDLLDLFDLNNDSYTFDNDTDVNGTMGNSTGTINMCYLNTYDTNQKLVRGLCEGILVLWSLVFLILAVRECSFLGPRLFFNTIFMCPSRCLFLVACLMSQLAVPFRFACHPEIEDRLALVIMLFTGPYFLFFCRGFKTTGPFVIMIYRMMAADLLRFVTIYFIFVMGFSQAYYIIFQSYSHPENPDPMETPIDSIIAVFIMSLGTFGNIWTGCDSTMHSMVGKIHTFIFLSIVVVLLVNLLIAMMGDTYTKIAEIKNEWMRQWARTVLIVERGIPPKERLRQQDLYSERMATGEKALVMKQTMTDEKLEEIKAIIEMKVTHRRNIKRRREKFGYESNSTIGLDLAGIASNVIAPEDGENECEMAEETF